MLSSQHPKRHPARRLWQWFALAVIIHAEVVVMMLLATYFWAPRQAELAALAAKAGGESIEVSTVDEDTARKILAELERQEEKAKEEQAKKEEEAQQPPGQVVDLAKPREEKRPENARFAAEHDSSVAKESKKYGKFDEKSRQGDTTGDDERSSPAARPTPPSKPAPPPNPGALAMRTPGAKGRPVPPGAAARTPQAPLGEPGEAVEAEPDDKGELGRKGTGIAAIPQPPPGAASGGAAAPAVPPSPQNPSLLPSPQQLARAIGSGTQDHLKDLDEGSETALNAKKWKFASFFNRVKQQVRDHWRPADEYRRRDPTGAIYGQKDRYTLLRVQLKPDGTLATVALELPSGVEFLDDEAIEAFKQAQPFPNPPQQLVDGDSGLIHFRFGFFFELSGAPRMKVFRYNSM